MGHFLGFTDKVKTMKKMMALISALAVLMIAFSGCVGDNKPAVNGTEPNNSEANVNPDESAADISEIESLGGFEYLGSSLLNETDIKIDYNAENISLVVGGSEGLYKHNESDLYVDVIELKNNEAANNLIDAYKSSFVPLAEGSRFVEESFNGHSSVEDYMTS